MAFVALIAVAGVNLISTKNKGVLGATNEGDLPLAQFAVPGRAHGRRRRRQHRPGRLRRRPDSLSLGEHAGPRPAGWTSPVRSASATSSTSRWSSRSGSPAAATARTRRTSSSSAYRRYSPQVNFLAIDVRDSDVRGPQADRGAPLDPPDRPRPGRRPLQPLPGRWVPHLRLRLSRRHPPAHLDRPARRSAVLLERRRPDRGHRAEGRDAALMAGAAGPMGGGAGAGLDRARARGGVPGPLDRLDRDRGERPAGAPSR